MISIERDLVVNVIEMKTAGILVVDDEENLKIVFKDMLQGEGYINVHSAADGEECLEIIKRLEEKIYVISLNLRMPGISGFDVMQHLANSHKHVVGIVMVTGTNDLKIAKEFLQLGTDTILAIDYITKPFEEKSYFDVIKKAVEMVQARRKAPIFSRG